MPTLSFSQLSLTIDPAAPMTPDITEKSIDWLEAKTTAKAETKSFQSLRNKFAEPTRRQYAF
jgi:hypothetical protein